MRKKLQEKKKRLYLAGRQISRQVVNWLQSSLFRQLVGVSTALVGLIFASYHLAYWGRIYPGITVADQPVGNLTVAEAIMNIEDRIANIESNSLILTHAEQQWEIKLEELGFSYQATQTAQKAYQVGRSGRLLPNLIVKAKAWRKGIDLSLEYTLDQELLETKLATIAQQVFIPMTEPAIKLADSQVTVEQGKEGQILDKEKLLSTISYQLLTINFNPINLPITHTAPILTPDQIENTRQRAHSFLGKRLILTDEEQSWELNQEELIQLLSFTNGFDQEKVASWAADLAVAVNRPPENATFQFAGGRVVEFRTAREGRTLDQERTVDLIAQSLAQLESLPDPGLPIPASDSEEEPKIILPLPVVITAPAVRTADINTLGIKQLVGRGISYFRGSIASRIHNIQLASSRLNGLLIPPGETFAFNQALGDVSKDTGFKEAYIIKEGRTVLGDGGGVCQVSTTLFRAALDAGLPIVERQPHAYRVSYYEQNSPVGLDATVFDPTADLKFKNDTPAHLLIQAKTDTRNKILTFELYGTPDGRITTISKSRIWDQTPPPPDLYQDDPTLPVGTIKQIDWKAWGAKVAFDYRVERNGEVLQDRTFYSAYRPWQAVFLRGTAPAQ